MELVFRIFDKHPGIWRVDGIGEVYIDGSRPRVQISFSRIKDGCESEPHKNSSLCTASEQQHLTLNLPFSAIMYFTVGSIWKDGKNIGPPNLIDNPISISSNQGTNLRLKDKLELGNSRVDIIPSTYFSLGGMAGNYSKLKETHYQVLPILDGSQAQYLILPHSEIYRFYISVSTQLCNAVIMDDIGKYVDFKNSKPGRSPTLTTLTRLSRLERFVFLRALCDPVAMVALRHSRNIILSKRINSNLSGTKTSGMLEAIFPFNGLTSLTVSGKKICLQRAGTNTPEIWAIFAMQIHSCNHPVSFHEPTIVSPETDRTARSASEKGGENGATSLAHIDDDSIELFGVQDQPASATMRRLSLVTPSSRFPSLWDLKYKFINKDGSHDNAGYKFDERELGEHYSIDEGDYTEEGSGNSGIDQSLVDQPPSRDLTDFIKMINVLEKEAACRKWSVNYLSNTNDIVSVGGVRISSFPKMNNRYNWYLIDSRPRQAVCVEIVMPEKTPIFMIEMELRPSESARSTAIWIPANGSIMNSEDLTNFLKLTAYRNRWPLNHHKWRSKKEEILAAKVLTKCKILTINHLSCQDNEYTDEHYKKWADGIIDMLGSLD